MTRDKQLYTKNNTANYIITERQKQAREKLEHQKYNLVTKGVSKSGQTIYPGNKTKSVCKFMHYNSRLQKS